MSISCRIDVALAAQTPPLSSHTPGCNHGIHDHQPPACGRGTHLVQHPHHPKCPPTTSLQQGDPPRTAPASSLRARPQSAAPAGPQTPCPRSLSWPAPCAWRPQPRLWPRWCRLRLCHWPSQPQQPLVPPPPTGQHLRLKIGMLLSFGRLSYHAGARYRPQAGSRLSNSAALEGPQR